MANLIERVVGDFGDKRRWRACKARLAATSVLDEITAALRAAQADTLRRLPSGRLDPPGPATLLLDADLRIQGSTSGMEDRLRRLFLLPRGWRRSQPRP